MFSFDPFDICCLQLPPRGDMATTGQVVPHEEPMNLQTLRRAAEEGDLQAMARILENTSWPL